MPEESRVDPMSVSVEQAAQVLGVARETLEADIAAGAPTNADGSVNLVHYAAWLVKEAAARGD